jgi:hypothetical protein
MNAHQLTTEVPMAGYEIVFEDDPVVPTPVPQPGETVDIHGALWDVERVELDGVVPRVHVVAHPSGEVAAHARPSVPIALAPPSSFEAELVYTLNDLSSRLNSLAGVLNAYWGQGAA